MKMRSSQNATELFNLPHPTLFIRVTLVLTAKKKYMFMFKRDTEMDILLI